MAKSKNGGTRAMLRGRVGSDVYSVGKDGKGKKQQVVRSLAEQVSNPRTAAQMFGRMVMSTIMQAVSVLSVLIDHAFDGLATGQPSISEFIRRNFKLAKADALTHPDASNTFGMVKYGEKNAKGGAYIIASGGIYVPTAVTNDSTALALVMTITKLATETTAGAIRALLGLAVGDYFTMVAIDKLGGSQFFRVKVADTLADTTTLTDANIASLFDFEGTITPTVALTGTAITITGTVSGGVASHGLIVSQYKDGSWQHNDAQMSVLDATYTADVAIDTYPIGSEKFLNGGDI